MTIWARQTSWAFLNPVQLTAVMSPVNPDTQFVKRVMFARLEVRLDQRRSGLSAGYMPIQISTVAQVSSPGPEDALFASSLRSFELVTSRPPPCITAELINIVRSGLPNHYLIS